MKIVNKENAIIIDGVKHTLVKDNSKAGDCLSCSLADKCKNDLCNLLYDVSNCHFEILNQEHFYGFEKGK